MGEAGLISKSPIHLQEYRDGSLEHTLCKGSALFWKALGGHGGSMMSDNGTCFVKSEGLREGSKIAGRMRLQFRLNEDFTSEDRELK